MLVDATPQDIAKATDSKLLYDALSLRAKSRAYAVLKSVLSLRSSLTFPYAIDILANCPK